MNKGCLIGGGIFLAIVVGLGLWLMGGYNSLVNSDENVKKSWANVESAYQRRADLIPGLVATVKGAVGAENKILTDVITARASATQMKIDPANLTPEKLAEFQASQGQLSQALGRLMVVSEQYPQLKSIDGFNSLQSQLEGTENRIKIERDVFNAEVATYNKQVRSFPIVLVAGMMGFDKKGSFTADAGSSKAPKVDFNNETN